MMNMEDFVVTTSLEDAASDILEHSFAIYRVDEDLTNKIRSAHHAATDFFRQVENDDGMEAEHWHDSSHSNKHHASYPYQRIVGGHLYGYNVPSPAKRLFRAYWKSEHQPWPKNDGKLRQSSTPLAEELHGLLADCTRKIVDEFWSRRHQRQQQQQEESSPMAPPARKRSRVDSPIGVTEEASDDVQMLSNLSFDQSKCPMDYFFYHNRHPSLVNCSEHIDRGVLVVVCLTNVPGLEVLPSSSMGDGDKAACHEAFVCPEILVHNANLYREVDDPCSNLICIMAGDQLAKLLTATSKESDCFGDATKCIGKEGSELQANWELPSACVHRVRSRLARARLSISYELRL